MTGSCNINVFKIDLKKVNIEIYLIKKSNKQGRKLCLVYNLNKKKSCPNSNMKTFYLA
jgi:hypothetical protein